MGSVRWLTVPQPVTAPSVTLSRRRIESRQKLSKKEGRSELGDYDIGNSDKSRKDNDYIRDRSESLVWL
jgi:hypothetical protein